MSRLAALAAALAILAAACGAAPAAVGPGGAFTATLTDSSILLSQAAIPNGPVTLVVKNIGKMDHALSVLKTNLAADKIPADPADASRADERGRVGGTAGRVMPGQSVELQLDLSAGKYVLLCNEPAHYVIGMRAPLTVN